MTISYNMDGSSRVSLVGFQATRRNLVMLSAMAQYSLALLIAGELISFGCE
jgi:hypothetical protein